MTQKTKRNLIPPRLYEIYRGWVAANPDFEKLCDDLKLNANSYAEAFHIDANRRGLLRSNEIEKTLANHDQSCLGNWLTEENKKGEMK